MSNGFVWRKQHNILNILKLAFLILLMKWDLKTGQLLAKHLKRNTITLLLLFEKGARYCGK